MSVFLHAASGCSDKSKTTKEFALSHWQELRMDDSEEFKPHFVSALLDMKQIDDNMFDAVFTSHSLEQLYAHEVKFALSNMLRVLKPEGYLLLYCTDLQAACTLISQGNLLETAYESPAGPVAPLDIVYGFRPALAAGQLRYARKCGFTVKALIGSLMQAGFASVWTARNSITYTIAGIASKSEMSEAQLKKIATMHFN